MFYSQQLLTKRGKFGIIWLAAIKSEKQLRKKDILHVKIARHCNDIIEIILGRGLPINEGDPRPRFSLRMSAQLMYGVIKIYRKQASFIYDDACHLVSRIAAHRMMPKVSHHIDLKTNVKSRVDAVTMKDPTEYFDALNPQFGHMQDIIQESFVLPSPQEDLFFNVPSFPDEDILNLNNTTEMDKNASFTAPLWQITMNEDPLDINEDDQTKEIFDKTEVDPMIVDIEEPSLSPIFDLPQIFVSEMDENTVAQIDRGEETPSIKPPAETSVIPVKKSLSKRSVDETYVEEQTEKKRRKRSPLGPLELESLHSPYVIIRNRKHKLIIDSEIRLSRNQLLNNANNWHNLCHLRPKLPIPSYKDAKALLMQPSSGPRVHHSLERFYRKKLVEKKVESDDDDDDFFRQMFPEEYTPSDTSDSSKSKHLQDLHEDTNEPVEKMRPSKHNLSDIPSLSAAISYDETSMVIEKNKSVESLKSLSKSTFMIPIIEEQIEDIEGQQPEPNQNLLEERYLDVPDVSIPEIQDSSMTTQKFLSSNIWSDTFKLIMEKLGNAFVEQEDVDLESVFQPQNFKRRDVARIFMLLLHFHKKQLIYLSQNESYGDIIIKESTNFKNFTSEQSINSFF